MLLPLVVSIILHPTFHSCSVEVDDSLKSCQVEYRETGKKWTSVEPFYGSLVGLKEDTRYEIRFKDGHCVRTKSSFKTWKTDVPIKKTIEIDPRHFTAPFVISEKGTPEGWIRYVVKGDRLHNESTLPTFEIAGAEYILLDGMKLTGVPGQRNVINIRDSKAVRVRGCDISGWGRVGSPNFSVFFEEKLKYKGRGSMYDENGDRINFDGAIIIGKGASEVVVERCYIHDSYTHTNSWYYSHPSGSECIIMDCPEHSTVIRYNDFIGSDGYCFNDCVEGARNFYPDGGFRQDADVYGNFMIFSNDDNIELDGGQKNIRVWGNRFESSYCGVSIQGCMVGPSFIWDNLFSGMQEEFGLSGQTIKTDRRNGNGARTFIWNNTLWGYGSGIRLRPSLVFSVHDNKLCGSRQGIHDVDKSPSSECYGNLTGVELEEKDLDSSYPKRDLKFSLDKARVSVGLSREPVVFKIKGDVPSGTKVLRPSHSDWFDVVLEGNKVRVTFNEDKMQKRRIYRGAFIVRTPDGLSRGGSVYASTEFIPPYQCEQDGQTAVYDNDFVLKGKNSATSSLLVDKPGRYWFLVHGYSGEGNDPRSVKLMVSVDGSEPLLSKQTMYGYPTWSILHPLETDQLLGLLHFDLDAGEHTVSITSQAGSVAFDGFVLTDAPWMFEPNRVWL